MERKQDYSPEFRSEAVKLVLEQGLSQGEAARRLSMPKGTLANWVAATGLPQLPIRHQCSSSSPSVSGSTANPSSAARNSSEVAANNRLVLMLVLTEVFSRTRFNAIWRTSARLWATWPVRARA